MQARLSPIRPIAILLTLCGSALAQPVMTDLGTLPGGTEMYAFGISADGSTAVGQCRFSLTDSSAFRWTDAGGLQDLGRPPGWTRLIAYAVNADGSVITGDGLTGSGDLHMFRWTAASGIQDLGLLPGGTYSSGRGISDDGLTIVGFADASGARRAARWTPAGLSAMALPPGFSTAAANSVSADGTSAAGWSESPAGRRAVRWTGPGVAVSLGLLPGFATSDAWAISANGASVAGYCLGPGLRAYRWNTATGMSDLGVLPGFGGSTSLSICADGSAVGGQTTGGPTPAATLTTPANGTVLLSSYLTGLGTDLTGWTPTSINGFSTDATALVGFGRLNGLVRAFIVQSLPSLCAPQFTSQPQSIAASPAGNARFSVGATTSSGGSPLQYSWRKGAVPLSDGPAPGGSVIAGSLTPMLSISGISAADLDSYDCIVTNACGAAGSDPATLAFFQPCSHIVEEFITGAACENTSQLCGTVVEYIRETCGDLTVEYTAATSHCSRVGIRFFIDGVLASMTPPIDPGLSTGEINLGPLPAGPHTIGLEAYGVLGGCNGGTLEGWAGTLRLTYCHDPAALSDPSSITTGVAGPAHFSVVTGGSGPFATQWQKADPSAPGGWVNLADGPLVGPSGAPVCEVTGATSTDLALFDFRYSADLWSVLNGSRYRCAISSACSAAASADASLTICYANCDNSTTPPVLNVLDFSCFLNRFAAGNPYANCDGSTTPPVLNVLDFACFLNRFAAGCS